MACAAQHIFPYQFCLATGIIKIAAIMAGNGGHMSDLSHRPYQQDESLTSPDNPYEHKVCGVTLVCAFAFLATALYYIVSPEKGGLMMTVMAVTGGLFLLALLNFFAAAFRGKFCGCKKGEE